MEQLTPTLHFKAMEKLQAWNGFSAISAGLDRFELLNVYLAGGTLRNIIAEVSHPSKDFDFFISGADSEEFLQYLDKKGELTFGQFGSPRWHERGNDTHYCDIINIPSFDNGLWRCEDIVDVLNQFDFTANAIAINLRNGCIFDPQHGIRDARKRIMRAVRFDFPDEPIPANPRITRNSVLWMRLNHYSEVLGFNIEPITKRWMAANNHYVVDQSTFASIFFPPVLCSVLRSVV